MTLPLKRTIQIGLSVVMGLALAATVTAHFLLEALPSRLVLALAFFCLTSILIVLVYGMITSLLWAPMRHRNPPSRWWLLILPLVISSLLMEICWVKPQPLNKMINATIGRLKSLPVPLKAWGETHWTFEIHATVNQDPQWQWRMLINLPAGIKQFGGKLQLLVTQPEWAVFDQHGNVYPGGDGVEVLFVIERNGQREPVKNVKLNLHRYPQQHYWQSVKVLIPPGSQRLIIEAWPGPPGSNNWHDRVWISFERAKGFIDDFIKFTDWLTIALFIFLSTSALVLLSRSPNKNRKKRAIAIVAINVMPVALFFFLCETYLRIKGYQPYIRTHPEEYQNTSFLPDWAASDSLLGWTATKAGPETNSQGFRDKKNFATINLHSGKKRMMILGDSFMHGYTVRANENVASFLQAGLQDEYEVYNLGVPGWGIDQMYLAYQKYKDIINPHIVILAFIDDDVNRVLESYRAGMGMNKPSFALNNGELVPRPSPTPSQDLLNRLTSKSLFFSQIIYQIYLITEAEPIVEYIFLKMADETRRENRKFVVIRIPTIDDANPLTHAIVDLNDFPRLLQKAEAQYLEPLDEIRQFPRWAKDFYIDMDGHMSAAGNKFLADYIRRQVFGQVVTENAEIRQKYAQRTLIGQ